ncbi:MAG: restriction endonuclease, partial [Solirubrobacteraceae bacterium]
AAEKLDRSWVGIDVTYLAMTLIKSRLTTLGSSDYRVLGEPTTWDDAKQLSDDDPHQFEWWALSLVGAQPAKKGADHGIDGRLFFFDDGTAKAKQVIISVKGGQVHVGHVRDLVGVLKREKAQIGVVTSLNKPTRPMRAEAASAGFYASPWGQHPGVQLLTVAELLAGKTLDMPAGGAHMTQVALPPKPEPPAHPDQLSLGG